MARVWYERAAKPIGPIICCAGQAQTREALRRIDTALHEAGATLSDVVTDISRWREVGAVHAEVFGQIRPARPPWSGWPR